ncbi:MAG: DUF6326 family protein [Candidatus Thorarchaeota archaeon]
MEDVKINVKLILSALWVAAMFCYLYADVLGLFVPGSIAEILTGEIAGMPIDNLFLAASALFMVPPILMIFLSLALKAKVNRWVNIIVGAFYTLIGVSMVATSTDAGYLIYGIVESLLTALVVLYAWKWPE